MGSGWGAIFTAKAVPSGKYSGTSGAGAAPGSGVVEVCRKESRIRRHWSVSSVQSPGSLTARWRSRVKGVARSGGERRKRWCG